MTPGRHISIFVLPALDEQHFARLLVKSCKRKLLQSE